MKDVVGQISLFDMVNFMGYREDIPEPPILLKSGQMVFLVIKGDVEPFVVLDETWICGDVGEERGYRLQRPDGSAYNAIWNSSIGTSCFIDREMAHNIAEAYLSSVDVIRAEDIKPIKTTAYSYVREGDNREMIAFYSELDNGMVYIKEFMTFHHIVEANKKVKAIKKFMEQSEFNNVNINQIDYVPSFKNMYRIRQQYDWDYAEAGHSYAVG